MNTVYISFGSNFGDREAQIIAAAQCFRSVAKSFIISPLFEFPAINGKDAPYINAVAVMETLVDADRLILRAKEWEANNGRTPLSKQLGNISIDIDIVIFNEAVLRPREYDSPYFKRGLDLLSESKV